MSHLDLLPFLLGLHQPFFEILEHLGSAHHGIGRVQSIGWSEVQMVGAIRDVAGREILVQ